MNFSDMLQNLVARPAPRYVEDEVTSDAKVISLRPTPSLRHYLEHRASQLGDMSLHALIITMLKAYQKAEEDTMPMDGGFYEEKVSLIANRVRYLFSFHEYLPHEISDILKQYSVTPAVLLDDTRLTDALSLEALQSIAEAFGVGEDWLLGKDTFSLIYRQPTRHNASGIYRLAMEHAKNGQLERVIPFCRSSDLKENKLIYEKHGDDISVSIALRLKAPAGYCHSRFVIFEYTYFDYDAGRTEYKALLYALYKEFSSGATFQGQHLSDHDWDTVMGGQSLISEKVLDSASNYWDAEFYVGADRGNAPCYEVEELERVKQFAHEHIIKK